MRQTSGVHRRTFLKLLAVGVPGAAAAITVARNAGHWLPPRDALHQVVLQELAGFTTWLEQNHVKGFIGEVGWPDNTDGDASDWNQLAQAWFEAADRSQLWVAGWATGAWWEATYSLAMYRRENSEAGVDTPNTQASVLEAHPSTNTYLRGIAVAGGSFSAATDEPTSDFSNVQRGTYDVDYHYDGAETYQYLAQRGLRLARIDFRWERIQPTPGGPLDEAELAHLDDAVASAGAAGLQVVLDLHNYGAYYLSDGRQGVRQAIGSPTISESHFADVWQRLSAHYQDNPNVVAYGLMNEPTDLPTLFDAQTRFADLDSSANGWQADNGGPEVLSRISSPSHGGQFALKIAREFPSAPGYGHMRVHDNGSTIHAPRDLSGAGDTLALWVYLPADTGGSTWQARLFVYGDRRSFDAASVPLQRGNWTQVTGQFTAEALKNVLAVGIQVYCNDVAGPAWIALDGLAQGAQRTPAQVWEAASQSAVDSIRANGDGKLIAVGGYGWSRVPSWAEQHSRAWIQDPFDRIRYEGHHYWDRGRSSFYARPYADELSSARSSA